MRRLTYKSLLVAVFLGLLASPLAGQDTGELQAEDQKREWYVRRVDRDGALEWTRESDLDIGELRPRMMEIYEVSQHPGEPRESDAQRRAADDLVRQSLASAEEHGWYDFEKARDDGFELMFGDDVHYANETFITDDRLLDPNRPEVLLYYDTPKGMRLAGFMYLTRSLDERGLQIGGPLTVWHYHHWLLPPCMLQGLLVIGGPGPDGRCTRGFPNNRSPEMLHVWLLDHPEGSFATGMGLPPEMIEALAERPD